MRKQNRLIICFFVMVFGLSYFTLSCFGITLYTSREALRGIFSECDNTIFKEKTIMPAQVDKMKAKLGGKLVFHEHSPGAKEIMDQRNFTCYFGKKEGQTIAAAIILEEPGKWGPMKFIIRLSLEGKVQDIWLLSYTETRGRPIARRSFLSQFKGKGLNDELSIRKDITAISGATISSESAAFTVKKAIVLYNELFKE